MRIHSAITSICAAALVVAAAPAAADEPQSNSVTKGKRDEQQKKVCRWLPVTGSNMNQKVCLTAEDWKKAEAQAW